MSSRAADGHGGWRQRRGRGELKATGSELPGDLNDLRDLTIETVSGRPERPEGDSDEDEAERAEDALARELDQPASRHCSHVRSGGRTGWLALYARIRVIG